MSDEVLSSVEYDTSPYSGATTVTYQADVHEGVDAPREEDTIQVARGFEVQQGYMLSFSGRILDFNALTDLATIQEEDSDLDIALNWLSGARTTLKKGRLTATPVLDEVPDRTDLYYDTDVTVTDNPDTDADSSWTNVGRILGQDGNDADVTTTPDGRGLPIYIFGRFSQVIPIEWDSTQFANLKTEEDARNEVRIAISDQSGDWRIYGDGANNNGVHVEVRELAAPDPEEKNRMALRVHFTGSFKDFIRYEDSGGSTITPEDYHHGVEFNAMFYSQTRSDIITEGR